MALDQAQVLRVILEKQVEKVAGNLNRAPGSIHAYIDEHPRHRPFPCAEVARCPNEVQAHRSSDLAVIPGQVRDDRQFQILPCIIAGSAPSLAARRLASVTPATVLPPVVPSRRAATLVAGGALPAIVTI